jgi:hypothetical protein
MQFQPQVKLAAKRAKGQQPAMQLLYPSQKAQHYLFP